MGRAISSSRSNRTSTRRNSRRQRRRYGAKGGAVQHAETELAGSRRSSRKRGGANGSRSLAYQRDASAAALAYGASPGRPRQAEHKLHGGNVRLQRTNRSASGRSRKCRRRHGPADELAQIDQIDPISSISRSTSAISSAHPASAAHAVDVIRGAKRCRSRRPVNESGYPHEGRIDFAAISLDPTTGTLQVRGVFPNPDGRVLPGLFVRVACPGAEGTQRDPRSVETRRVRSVGALCADRQRTKRRRTAGREDRGDVGRLVVITTASKATSASSSRACCGRSRGVRSIRGRRRGCRAAVLDRHPASG